MSKKRLHSERHSSGNKYLNNGSSRLQTKCKFNAKKRISGNAATAAEDMLLHFLFVSPHFFFSKDNHLSEM